jgi:hypothetical protein
MTDELLAVCMFFLALIVFQLGIIHNTLKEKNKK